MNQLMIIKEDELKELMGKLDAIITTLSAKEQKVSSENYWLTQEEAKKALNVGVRTLQNYRDNGTLSFSKVGRKIRYRKEDVESLLQKHYVKGFEV
jgi:excisionase family DNA binding protein